MNWVEPTVTTTCAAVLLKGSPPPFPPSISAVTEPVPSGAVTLSPSQMATPTESRISTATLISHWAQIEEILQAWSEILRGLGMDIENQRGDRRGVRVVRAVDRAQLDPVPGRVMRHIASRLDRVHPEFRPQVSIVRRGVRDHEAGRRRRDVGRNVGLLRRLLRRRCRSFHLRRSLLRRFV